MLFSKIHIAYIKLEVYLASLKTFFYPKMPLLANNLAFLQVLGKFDFLMMFYFLTTLIAAK